MGVSIPRIRDQTEINVVADLEREAGEGRNFPPGKPVPVIGSVFALHRPVLAGMGARDEIYSLITIRQIEMDANLRGNFRQQPDIRQLRTINWTEQQVILGQLLEEYALVGRTEVTRQCGEISPIAKC